MTLDDFKCLDHFVPDEFERFGGYERVDFEVVKLADRIREEYGRPLFLTRAFDNPEHNAMVGGVQKSRHLIGQALDLITTHPDRVHYPALVMATLRVWCGGLGLYSNRHIHIDIRPGARGSRWIVIEGETHQWTWPNLQTLMDHVQRYS